MSWLRIHDYVACCAPFGLFFGRIANFVNGELWGRPADVPWAIVFPNTVPVGMLDPARHPSQLYEAGLEGIALFAILWFLFWRTKARHDPGKLVGAFVLGYGCFRYFIEFFREADAQYLKSPILGTPGLHMGQLLCLPMIAGRHLPDRDRQGAPRAGRACGRGTGTGRGARGSRPRGRTRGAAARGADRLRP